MKRKVNLEYYVLRYDWNKQVLVNYNIFGSDFIDNIYITVKKHKIQTLSDLKKFLTVNFKYCYWSKSEHEVIISDLSEHCSEKIDIYRQIEPNLDLITEYVNNKMQLNLK